MLFSAIRSQSTGGLWKPQSPPTPEALPPFSTAALSGSQSPTSGSGVPAAFSNPPSRSSWGHTKTRFWAALQGSERSLDRGDASTAASALASLAWGHLEHRPRSPPNSQPW